MSDEEKKEKAERAYQAVDKIIAGLDFGESTPLDDLARAQHEVTETFEKHGFARKEALYMTACMFNGTPGTAPG